LANLYPNPALSESNLSRQGTLEGDKLKSGEVFNQLYYNIEQNSFKLFASNYRGDALDEEARQAGTLLPPDEVKKRFGLSVEAPISEGNARRMIDNQDEVIRKNLNLASLDNTSFNQIVTFATTTAGSIITDPVNIALAGFTLGVGTIAAKVGVGVLSRFGAGLNFLSKIEKIRAATGVSASLAKVGAAAVAGGAENLIEGLIESEILLKESPKAGLKFTEEDYWDNVRANVFFGTFVAGARRGVSEFRRRGNFKASSQAAGEISGNVRAYEPPPRQRSGETPGSSDTSGRPTGSHFTTHFSANREYSFETQTPFSKSNLGEGFQFTSSRERAFSDKGLGIEGKEDIFEINLDNVSTKLLDSEKVIPLELREQLVKDLAEDLRVVDKDLVDIEGAIKNGDVSINQLTELLGRIDEVKGTASLAKFNKVVKDNGYNGFTFDEGSINPRTGEPDRGVHLFDLPEGVDLAHLNPDRPPSTVGAAEAQRARDAQSSEALDFYADPRNRLGYSPEIEARLNEFPSDIRSDMREIHAEEMSFMSTQLDELTEEMDLLSKALEPVAVEGKPPVYPTGQDIVSVVGKADAILARVGLKLDEFSAGSAKDEADFFTVGSNYDHTFSVQLAEFEEGNLDNQLLYHAGGDFNIDEFDPLFMGGTDAWLGKGMYFSPSASVAAGYLDSVGRPGSAFRSFKVKDNLRTMSLAGDDLKVKSLTNKINSINHKRGKELLKVGREILPEEVIRPIEIRLENIISDNKLFTEDLDVEHVFINLHSSSPFEEVRDSLVAELYAQSSDVDGASLTKAVNRIHAAVVREDFLDEVHAASKKVTDVIVSPKMSEILVLNDGMTKLSDLLEEVTVKPTQVDSATAFFKAVRDGMDEGLGSLMVDKTKAMKAAKMLDDLRRPIRIDSSKAREIAKATTFCVRN